MTTFKYLPSCSFNIFNQILSLIYGFTGFRMKKYEPDETQTLGDEMEVVQFVGEVR